MRLRNPWLRLPTMLDGVVRFFFMANSSPWCFKKWLPNLSFFIITQFELLSTLSLCSLTKFVYATPVHGGDHRLLPGKTEFCSARTVILVDDF